MKANIIVSRLLREDLSMRWKGIKGCAERTAKLLSSFEVDIPDKCSLAPFKKGQYIKLKSTAEPIIISDIIYDVESKTWLVATPWRYATDFDKIVSDVMNKYGFDRIEIIGEVK